MAAMSQCAARQPWQSDSSSEAKMHPMMACQLHDMSVPALWNKGDCKGMQQNGSPGHQQ